MKPYSALDTSKCPLCGEPNQCASAADPSANKCWCEPKEFPRELLDQIPSDAIYKVCICSECLERFQENVGDKNVSS